MTTDQAATAEPQSAPGNPPTPEPSPAAEVDWKAKSREWERRAKENAKAAERLAAIEEAQKSEAQKAADALAAAQREAESARLDALRYRVGVVKGLPPEMVGRLQGTTEDELAADADALAALLKPAAPPVAGRPTAPQSGAVPPADGPPAADGNAWLRAQAGKSSR